MEENKNETQGASCGCGGSDCCKGPQKWIWVVLVVAIAGVLIAKNAGNKKEINTPLKPEQIAKTEKDTNATVSVSQPSKTVALPKLVDLGATKCIPCKMMAPILEELKNSYTGKLEVVFIDVWENAQEGEKYGIKMIPTQIFYDSAGKELFRHEGFFAKEDILAKWKEFGVELGAEQDVKP